MKTSLNFLQMAPVTLAVAFGPLITLAYRMTRSAQVSTGGLSLGQAVRGLLCALMFVSLLLARRWHALQHRFIFPVLFLATCAALASFTNPFPREDLVFAVRMIFLALIFASAFQIAKEGLSSERWLTISAWVVLLSMVGCIGAGWAMGRRVAAYGSQYATAGLFDQPWLVSTLVLSTLPVFIRLIPRGSMAYLGMILLFASLFFTMCRTTLIAAVVATGGSFLMNLILLKRRTLRRTTLVPAGVLLLLAGIGLSTPAGGDLVKRFRDLDPREGTGSGRYVFWQISIEHIVTRPARVQWLGEGMGSIREVIQQRFGIPIGCHNDCLDLVNAYGLCGLIGIGWWYWELVRFAWYLRGQREGLFQGAYAAVIILGLTSLGTGGFYDPSWALSYAALGFWAGCTIDEREPSYA